MSYVDDENEFEDDDTEYEVSPEGYKRILGWIRFQVQFCELEHGDIKTCKDETHKVAYMLTYIIVPLMQSFDIPTDVFENQSYLDDEA
jgi:hypothetical protein